MSNSSPSSWSSQTRRPVIYAKHRKCECGLLYRIRTAGTPQNNGRVFYGCQKYPTGCKKFGGWLDELPDEPESVVRGLVKDDDVPDEAESAVSGLVEDGVVKLRTEVNDELSKLWAAVGKLQQKSLNVGRNGSIAKLVIVLFLGFVLGKFV